MKWFWGILIFLVCAVTLVGVFWNIEEKMPLPTVASVDVERYMGSWYEIARLPNYFEKKVVSGNVQAHYTLNKKSNYVEVRNSYETENGEIKHADAIAFVVDKKTNSRLKVSFVPLLKYAGLFAAPYYIIALDEKNYQYAMVGTPDRKYLWILSRNIVLNANIYTMLISKASELGFKTEELIVNPLPKSAITSKTP